MAVCLILCLRPRQISKPIKVGVLLVQILHKRSELELVTSQTINSRKPHTPPPPMADVDLP